MRMGTLIFIALSLLFGYSTFVSIGKLMNFLADRKWPEVEAKILKFELEKVISSGDGGDLLELSIEYQYEVGGIIFTSNRINHHNKNEFSRSEIINRFDGVSPETTLIRFNPDEPAYSIVMPEAAIKVIVLVFASSLLSILSIVMAVRSLVAPVGAE